MSAVTAVIPNRNGAAVIERCLDALAGVDEVIVVDDASTDGSRAFAALHGARVLDSPGRGFAAAVNHGIRAARNELVLLLNSDAFVEPETARRLAGAIAADARLGLCAAALVREDGSRARTFGPLLTLNYAIRVSLALPTPSPRERGGVQEVDFVPLACALARREALLEVGGLDERYRFYFEDHDLCWRLAEHGWKVAVCWEAVATHVEGGSSRALDPPSWFAQFHESRLRYLRKRYPRAWPLYIVAWIPSAFVRSGLWLARRNPRWAVAYLRAAVAGLH